MGGAVNGRGFPPPGSRPLRSVQRALLDLPDQERTVLALYYFEELRLHEIAEVLGLTESRVSQIRSKALRTLRGACRTLRAH